MISVIVGLPIWGIIRSLGLVSFALVAAGLCLGIVYGFPGWSRKRKALLYRLHTYATNGGALLGLLHGVVTVIDTYMPFDWSEVLIPFAASHHPVLTGLGTIAGYGLLLIIFTSDIRAKLGKKLWLAIHLSAYPVFVAALLHGLLLGTDSGSGYVIALYFGSVLVLLLLTFVRFMLKPSAESRQGGVQPTRTADRGV